MQHLHQPILTTKKTADKTHDDVIFPDLYKGERISRDRFKELVNNTTNHKGNVNNLVYTPSQAPSKSSNKGWKHVICAPTDETGDDWHKKSLF